ncbi:hypothetical protein MFLO_15890 [Listeria floridensis FSL S10-1187]|uniref:Uncharacterized protein n=1 Tax=Listeria floridensis FSL S10-1187 TaxID=1265817 RepID=A0ABN0RB71_9LIST|nr:hypothetical protein [Listeria floridensis]EUJ23496.1 hypothetical protein MFLO_15890 [Listeria floridensis FSL S10-1187]
MKKIERIRVYHNSLEEMRATINELIEQGYSENTRVSVSGLALYKERGLRDFEIEVLKEKHPDLIIHQDKEGWLSDGYFIYCTEHEREIK